MRNDAGLLEALKAIQREVGGGVTKAVNVTFFIGSDGSYAGRSRVKVEPLYPRMTMNEIIKEADLDALSKVIFNDT